MEILKYLLIEILVGQHIINSNMWGIVDNNQFKSYYLNPHDQYSGIEWLRLYGTSVENIVKDGQNLGLNYLVIEDKQYALSFLDDLYEDKKSYPYLIRYMILIMSV